MGRIQLVSAKDRRQQRHPLWTRTTQTRAGVEAGSSVSKRIRNYRTGDRAEDLGIFLLRAFCAVAPIPRQEDFGLADAVATLLRHKAGEVVHTWTPAHGREALADIVPLIQLLGLHSRHHPELWTRVHEVEAVLRGLDERGILAGLRPFQQMIDNSSRLAEIAKDHPIADVVVTVQILRLNAEGANFWIHSHGRDGPSGTQRYEGTWEELKQKGFDYKIEGDGPDSKVTLSLNRYFANQPVPHEIFEGPEETPALHPGDHSPCFFLRRLTLKPANTPEGDAET